MRLSTVCRIVIACDILVSGFFLNGRADTLDASSVELQFDDSSWYSKDDPRAIDAVQKRYDTDFSAGKLSAFILYLKSDFDSSSTNWSSNPGGKEKFSRELDTLLQEAAVFDSLADGRIMGKKPAIDSVVDKMISSIKTNRFAKCTMGMGMIGFFCGKPTQIILRVCETDNDTGCLTTEQAVAIRLRAKTIDQFFNRLKEPLRKRMIDAADASSKAWDNYLFGSPYLFPWELFVNGIPKNASNVWTPPKYKWLFLHPGLGILLRGWRTKDLESMTLDRVLTVELGGIKYLDDARVQSLGAGALVCFGGLNPVQYGAVLHYNSVMVGAAAPFIGLDDVGDVSFIGSIDIIGFVHWAGEQADRLFSRNKERKTEAIEQIFK